MDPAVSKRIHQLNFSRTQKQLAEFVDAFGLNSPSNTSFIQLQINSYNYYCEPLGNLVRFLSSPFSKLSKLYQELQT